MSHIAHRASAPRKADGEIALLLASKSAAFDSTVHTSSAPNPDMASLSDGSLAVCYDTAHVAAFGFSDGAVWIERYDREGDVAGLDVISVGQNAYCSSVTGLADGGYVVFYETREGGVKTLWFTIRNGDGSERAAPKQLGSPGSRTYGAALKPHASGNWTVTYLDGCPYAIAKVRFSASGTRLGSKRTVM